MKKLGLIGGMSFESTMTYYQLINRRVAQQLGGLHSANLVIYSVDFAEIAAAQHANDWETTANILMKAAINLKQAGCEGIVICTNTMHKVAEQVQAACGLPLLHIADATGAEILANNYQSVGLLATQFTMEQSFYKGYLETHYHAKVQVPSLEDRLIIHRIIYEELCRGVILDTSRQAYQQIIQKMVDQGCDSIILGCTEIGLLIQQSDSRVPLLDTTVLHSYAATDWMLSP